MRFYEIPGYEAIGPLPSVTTVLKETYNKGLYGPIFPGSAVAQNIQQRAEIGTAVHKLAELSFRGKPHPQELIDSYEGEPFALYKQVWPVISGLKIFVNSKGNLCLEQFLWSLTFMVAGRTDFIVERPDGALEIWDLKTAKRKKSQDQQWGYFLQTAAYAQCASELTGRPVVRCVLMMVYATRNKAGELDPSTQELSLSGISLKAAKEQFLRYRKQFQQLIG